MTDSFEYTPIPFNQLSKVALDGVIEEFINREGTDYGMHEFTYEQKSEQVLSLIRSGDASIVFDHNSQTASILHKDQL
jgi:uncharacterized protein YheU (UPF0270 family)